jgi:hypothetical protein
MQLYGAGTDVTVTGALTGGVSAVEHATEKKELKEIRKLPDLRRLT